MAWGLEVRPPFLHKSFIEYVMHIEPLHKMINQQTNGIEKFILRKAFEKSETTVEYLPPTVLWR